MCAVSVQGSPSLFTFSNRAALCAGNDEVSAFCDVFWVNLPSQQQKTNEFSKCMENI